MPRAESFGCSRLEVLKYGGELRCYSCDSLALPKNQAFKTRLAALSSATKGAAQPVSCRALYCLGSKNWITFPAGDSLPNRIWDHLLTYFLQIPHFPPSFAQCLQYLQFLQA